MHGLRQLRQGLPLRLLRPRLRRIGLYGHRFYRDGLISPDEGRNARFRSFTVAEGESDLWIAWNRNGPGEGAGPEGFAAVGSEADFEAALERAARESLLGLRRDIQGWGAAHSDFFGSLEPLPLAADAPPVVSAMLEAGRNAQVGPMAAVAGAIAELMGVELRARFDLRELIVENGGDLWISIAEPLSISVYAGLSSLSGKIALVFDPEAGLDPEAGSSGTVGPSLSFGKADAAVAIAPSAAAADAWATALGNRIRSAEDLEGAAAWAVARRNSAGGGPTGALAILGDRLAAAGKLRLGPAPRSSLG